MPAALGVKDKDKFRLSMVIAMKNPNVLHDLPIVGVTDYGYLHCVLALRP
jgi:hypothetical protein